LSIIFGMLRVGNFVHGAQYMLGAFVDLATCCNHLGSWFPVSALALARLLVGVDPRCLLGLEPRRRAAWNACSSAGSTIWSIAYGLLAHRRPGDGRRGPRATYGYGAAGQPYHIPHSLKGGVNLGFMFLPYYRLWVIVFSASSVCLAHLDTLIEHTKLGAYLRAATENPAPRPGLRHQRAEAC
jgi:branched-subunit amino acid ABC-type transport system permease component